MFVFADAHTSLTDPVVLRSVKEAAQSAGPGRTIVVTAPTHRIPPELDGIAAAWTHEPPDEGELTELVARTIARLTARGVPVSLDADGERALARSLRGSTLAAAERIIQQAVLDDGVLGPGDIDLVRREKFAGLAADGVLELIESEHRTLDAVGGLDGLKQWLNLRGSAIGSSRASELGIAAPRGALLTGIPGCGKSFVAKTLAATWGLPLLLLDPARLYRKFVGESEQRLERARDGRRDGTSGPVDRRDRKGVRRWDRRRRRGVDEDPRLVPALAPGSTRRGLRRGHLQRRVGATPELLRKGRFDEVFFVDLPRPSARRHPSRVTRAPRSPSSTFDLPKLVEVTDGFSGAEIEAVVVGALYRAFGARGAPHHRRARGRGGRHGASVRRPRRGRRSPSRVGPGSHGRRVTAQ